MVKSVDTYALKLRFWGVRGSIPCPETENMKYGGNTSCVQLCFKDQQGYLILDSGSGIRPLGVHLENLQLQKSGHIFITHAHWDHIQGFPFFKPIYDEANNVSIHMPLQDSGNCKQVLTGQLTPTHFPVTADMLSAKINYVTQSPEVQHYQGFSVNFMLANHPVTTAIYKIQSQGKTVVYAPDNELVPEHLAPNREFRNALIAFCKDADVLIHDGNYNLKMYEKRRNWGHSAWEDATQMAIEAGVKHLFLTHHDPTATDSMLDERAEELKQYTSEFDSIQLTREGLEYTF
jgi:phosphoribosyl 1,2-cyclic phosphodiesterase